LLVLDENSYTETFLEYWLISIRPLHNFLAPIP
jgi:hypothetical protein